MNSILNTFILKNIFLLTVVLTICIGCSTTKNSMEAWVGRSKQSFIKTWGPAIRTLNNDKNGEILIYADQVYASSNNQRASQTAASNYWNYTYVYINNEGKVSSWRKERQAYPPQQITVVNLLETNAISSK